MAIDYGEIANDRARLERTATNSIRTLARLYAERAHFVYELLQNAEDAIRRRPEGWNGSRTVSFQLFADCLRVSHYGVPFNENDVRAICSVGDSTKKLTDIGRFGIGFKSVYAFTDRPEIHSGNEDFAIEDFVKPVAVTPVSRDPQETVLILPIRADDHTAHAEIAEGLQKLGPRTLLFLRQIEEIAWRVEDGPYGIYIRSKPELVSETARRIQVIGESQGKVEIEESWLIFSRPAKTATGDFVGNTEVAFSTECSAPGKWTIQRVSNSPLVVYFPTILSTNLGFLIQGPFQTTPSRDNVPPNEPWNQHLVRQTSDLAVQALRELRDGGMLDANALQCMPLDRSKFDGTMFVPIFDAVKKALTDEHLLPCHGGGHVPATKATLARTQELRDLFSPEQLGKFLDRKEQQLWLTGDITQDRTPDLRQYLMRELSILEFTPESIAPTLRSHILEAQSDDWIVKLYEFFNRQSALARQGRLDGVYLVRLEDGTHITAKKDGQPQAFLPSEIETEFPTVRTTVCKTVGAVQFLQSLGLTTPDAVDDIVRNVLPKYKADEIDIDDKAYEDDFRRILNAFKSDLKDTQRDKLLSVLKTSTFVMCVDAGDGSKGFAQPGELYLATERLKALFSGVVGILLVDDSYTCLRGEDVRELLEACGATRYLAPISFVPQFTYEQLREMRRKGGCEDCSSDDTIVDHTLRGMDELLAKLRTDSQEQRAQRARLLWESLGDVQDRRGVSMFSTTYRWTYYHRRSYTFDAAFVRRLNEAAWVPAPKGELLRPDFVDFNKLGWSADVFLCSKIRFKPPIIEALAKEAGIEPGLLDLLKKLGVTSEAELRNRLGIEDQPITDDVDEPDTVGDAITSILGDDLDDPTPPIEDPTGAEPPPKGGTGTGGGKGGGGGPPSGAGKETTDPDHDGPKPKKPGEKGKPSEKPKKPASGPRPFISYLGTHPDEEEPDPDGLDHEARLALEEVAIQIILAIEPQLHRTAKHNPGYDLFEKDASDQPTRWIEVKAMTGSLDDRPVGLSHTQFECAREHASAYWLYIVEHAGEREEATLVRIQDPAGKAKTFTFDRGWRVAAEESPADTKEGDE